MEMSSFKFVELVSLKAPDIETAISKINLRLNAYRPDSISFGSFKHNRERISVTVRVTFGNKVQKCVLYEVHLPTEEGESEVNSNDGTSD